MEHNRKKPQHNLQKINTVSALKIVRTVRLGLLASLANYIIYLSWAMPYRNF